MCEYSYGIHKSQPTRLDTQVWNMNGIRMTMAFDPKPLYNAQETPHFYFYILMQLVYSFLTMLPGLRKKLDVKLIWPRIH